MILKLSITQMLFNAVFQFSNLFINAYLFKEHHDVQLVALYNFYMFLFWGITFYIGFKCCEKNTRIGQAMSGVSCIGGTILLMCGIQNVLWLGMFMGAAGGFFWTSYLSVYRSLGKNSESGGTFAKVSLMATLVTVFIPLLFGHIVEGSSYFIGFLVLLGLGISMFVMSKFVPAHQTQPIRLQKSSFKHPQFITTCVLQGFYFSFVNISAGLLVYMAGKGEASMGSFATYYGMVTVGVTFLIAYILPSKLQLKALSFSTLIYLAASLLFIIDWSGSVIAFNFALAFAGPLFLNTLIGMHFLYSNHHYQNGEEGLLVRELALTLGKLLFFGYMAIFGLEINTLSFMVLLFIGSLFPFAISILLKTKSFH